MRTAADKAIISIHDGRRNNNDIYRGSKKDVQSINFEELEKVAGGASYDKLPASEVASFRKTLACYKREGATKEQIIKIYREEAPTWGASKEQIEIVVDLINDSWDSL